MPLAGLLAPAHARGTLVARPGAAVALRRRLSRDRVLGRPGCGRGLSARGPGAPPGRGPLRRAVRRLAVVLGRWRGARRSLAFAVQGVLPRRQRPPGRRGGHDVPRRSGSTATSPSCAAGSRASRRSSARSGSPVRSASRRPPIPACERAATFGGTVAAYERRIAQGAVTLEQLSEPWADPQRPAARQRAPLPPARRRAARTSPPCTSSYARAAATERSRRSGRAADARAVRRSGRGARRAATRSMGRASGSRSPTRWTTWRPCASSRRDRAPPGRRSRRRGLHGPLHRR